MSIKPIHLVLPLLAMLCLCSFGCTTVTRADGSEVRIPAGGFVGSMAAANITCQDNVQALITENTKLHARIAELEARLNDAQKKAAERR